MLQLAANLPGRHDPRKPVEQPSISTKAFSCLADGASPSLHLATERGENPVRRLTTGCGMLKIVR